MDESTRFRVFESEKQSQMAAHGINAVKHDAMKYLILRRRSGAGEGPLHERAQKRGEADPQFPFDVNSQVLRDRDVGDLRRDPSVEEVIPSIPFTLIKPVPGPVAESPWGIEAVGADSSPQNGDGVTVAVLDTGIDTTHVAFSGLAFDADNLMDFTTDERGVAGSAPDEDGHGTHVAGTIFGRDVNGARIGVAPGIKKVLIGKVLGPQGGPTESVFNAIEWALKRRADVISMSLGMDFPGIVTQLTTAGYPKDIAASRALEAYRSNVRLFDRLANLVEARVARGRGALLVAASGNESRRHDNLLYTVATAPPAAADGFIAVGAVSQTGDASSRFAVAHFSNTGCLVSAPGEGILSAKRRAPGEETLSTKRGVGLVCMSGTSMATPHVAGVMALWIQKLFPAGDRPNAWARDVQRSVENYVTEAPGQTRNDVGLGIVRAPQESLEQSPQGRGSTARRPRSVS